MTGPLSLSKSRARWVRGFCQIRIRSLAFSPDGKRLASASWDHTVKVWDARPWTPELKVEYEALGLVRSLFDDARAAQHKAVN